MRVIKLIISLILLLNLHSCTNTEKGVSSNFFRLKIALDTNSNFYLDSIRLFNIHNSRGYDYQEYDSILKQLVYVFDSVEKGSVNVTLVSVLDRTFDKNLFLRSDTTMHIRNNEINNFIDIHSKHLTSSSFNKGDTIVIGLISNGCFHSTKENIIINKLNGYYNVVFNSQGSSIEFPYTHLKRVFDSPFSKALNMFYNDCKSLLKMETLCISTTSMYVLIRIGNNVYQLPDFGCKHWKGYDNLFNKLVMRE